MFFASPYLGIISDFFDWISELLNNLVFIIKNHFFGLGSLLAFAYSLQGQMIRIAAWLPSILSTFLIFGCLILIVKFVLGR